MTQVPYHRRHGLSRLEVLIIVAGVVVLLLFALPAVYEFRQSANRQETDERMKQIVMACHKCNDFHKHLPPIYHDDGEYDTPGPWQGTTGTTHAFLLPFLGYEDLYKAASTGLEKLFSAANNVNGAPVTKIVVPEYISSLDWTNTNSGLATNAKYGNFALSNYAANFMVFGNPGGGAGKLWYGGLTIGQINAADGTANTVFFATRFGNIGTTGGSLWGHGPPSNAAIPGFAAAFAVDTAIGPSPSNDPFPLPAFDVTSANIENFAGQYYVHAFISAGCQVAMGDGSVRICTRGVEKRTWTAVLTPRGFEGPGGDDD